MSNRLIFGDWAMLWGGDATATLVAFPLLKLFYFMSSALP